MRTAYAIAICIMLVTLGMVMFPSLHGIVSGISIASYLPLVGASVTFLPYAFLLFIVYAIYKTRGG